MKKILFSLLLSGFFLSSCEITGNLPINTGNSGGLSTSEIASGLKEALRVGTDTATKSLSAVNGFFSNAAVKVLMPPEAQKVEKTLRDIGMGKLVDNAILSMNRAAEDASKFAGNIFWDAIKQMTIQDAIGILKGGDFAATDYLKKHTTSQLTAAFRPVVEKSLVKTDATKYWKDVFTVYNRFSTNPVNTDLTAYVTEKALSGIFHEIGLEEQKIRKDPVARVTEILKKVFGSNQAS
ncbi:MAG: DUF4197 domain-containing protein [Chitinophagaceae bacterium]|nr:DUF4197 domain-containing protein [Chitinophagaceae bacterium]MCW5915517.1 DUF4197 domain-containing protein [Chitinophagaceae bacterium]MCZ2397572.1 DUF4197 domain-containing protein [Chitinophagales bacterium]